MKHCSRCRTVLEADKFYTRTYKGKRGSTTHLTSECKQCVADRGRDYYQKNKYTVKAYVRDKQLYARYGITEAEYQTMLKEQDNVCYICKKPEKSGNVTNLSVDHCHITGAVRRLLCRRCNGGLGSFDDSPELLRKAAYYLENVQKEQI